MQQNFGINPDMLVWGTHRLLPPGEVDNGEPTVPHDGTVQALLPMLVRPSVADGSVHPAQRGLIRQTIAGVKQRKRYARNNPVPQERASRYRI